MMATAILTTSSFSRRFRRWQLLEGLSLVSSPRLFWHIRDLYLIYLGLSFSASLAVLLLSICLTIVVLFCVFIYCVRKKDQKKELAALRERQRPLLEGTTMDSQASNTDSHLGRDTASSSRDSFLTNLPQVPSDALTLVDLDVPEGATSYRRDTSSPILLYHDGKGISGVKIQQNEGFEQV